MKNIANRTTAGQLFEALDSLALDDARHIYGIIDDAVQSAFEGRSRKEASEIVRSLDIHDMCPEFLGIGYRGLKFVISSKTLSADKDSLSTLTSYVSQLGLAGATYIEPTAGEDEAPDTFRIRAYGGCLTTCLDAPKKKVSHAVAKSERGYIATKPLYDLAELYARMNSPTVWAIRMRKDLTKLLKKDKLLGLSNAITEDQAAPIVTLIEAFRFWESEEAYVSRHAEQPSSDNEFVPDAIAKMTAALNDMPTAIVQAIEAFILRRKLTEYAGGKTKKRIKNQIEEHGPDLSQKLMALYAESRSEARRVGPADAAREVLWIRVEADWSALVRAFIKAKSPRLLNPDANWIEALNID